LNYASKSDRQLETLEDGTKVSAGIKRMLDGRGKTLESELEKILTDKFKARGEEFHFPPPTIDTRHTSKEMPAGAVLIIAEDRLHRDEFKASGNSTEELAASQAAHDKDLKDIAKYDQTKCKVEDFEKLKANAGLTEEIIKSAPFFNLPRSTQEENNQETNSRRLTPEEAERQAAELEGASKLKESYTEGRAEAAKYVEAMKNIHSGAEHGAAKADFHEIAAGKSCPSNKWLNNKNADPSVCMALIRSRSDCSQEYFNHATDGDGNCGCVTDAAKDCTTNQRSARKTRIYAMQAQLAVKNQLSEEQVEKEPIETQQKTVEQQEAEEKQQADEVCAQVLDEQCKGLQTMQSFKAKGKMHSLPEDYKCVRMYKCPGEEEFGPVAEPSDCKKEKDAKKVCAAQIDSTVRRMRHL